MEPRRICTRGWARKKSEIFDSSLVNQMPTEVLLNIFDYLSPETKLFILPRVCRRWLEIQSDRLVFRDICFTDKPKTSECVFILTHAKSLRSLKLNNRTDANAILQVVSKCNPTIESLTLIGCRGARGVHGLAVVHLNMILKSCTELRVLEFEQTSTNSKTFYANIGKSLPHLTSIKLCFIPGNMNNYLPSITANCSQLKHVSLHSLDLDNSCSDEVVSALCERHKMNLETLDLNASEITDTTMELISQCSQLTQLHLHHLENVTNGGIMHLRQLLNLRSLLVSDCPVSLEVWGELFVDDNLNTLEKLTLHNIHGNKQAINRLSFNFGFLRSFRIVSYTIPLVFTENGDIIDFTADK